MNQKPQQPRLKPGNLRRWDLEDPYLRAALRVDGPKRPCHVCDRMVLGIIVVGFTLPPEIDRNSTILKGVLSRMVVGINCGCYAKFHRQMAYIIGNMNRQRESAAGGRKLYNIPTP